MAWASSFPSLLLLLAALPTTDAVQVTTAHAARARWTAAAATGAADPVTVASNPRSNISHANLFHDEWLGQGTLFLRTERADFVEPEMEVAECLPPGVLKFAHVMKSGGLSVDAYLRCRCEREGCSLSFHEGGDGILGHTGCARPSVCTSHRPPFMMNEVCPEADFSQARLFTLLRDPVERVVSFYNYMKYPRPNDGFPGYGPYAANSLKDVVKAWGVVDLNDGQPSAITRGGCLVCATQIFNAMVLHHFASEASLSAQETWNETAGVRVPPEGAMMFQLEEAKKTLAAMDAVFVEGHTFKEAFERNDLLRPGGGQASSECELPVANPTTQKDVPTQEELELIAAMNWADIELYNFAKTLPSARF